MMLAAVLAAAISSSDAQFVRAALNFNSDELARAKIAMNTRDVLERQYAEHVSSTLGPANLELIGMARQHHVMLEHLPNPQPGAPSTAQPPQPATPPAQRYFANEIARGRAAEALYQREAGGGGSQQLRDFARRTLATIRANVALAQRYATRDRRR